MADHERDSDTIIGRDADAASTPVSGYGDAVAEQLNQTTSEDAGGSVSGTGASGKGGDLDIIFEPEEDEDVRH